ncbi:hypothetical protein, partial [Gluconobacter cerinus]|uniref:hypothetical protein n=1 Tax=Gluconobacter cerinus TaxID=38307 RepID=UPI001B8A9B34
RDGHLDKQPFRNLMKYQKPAVFRHKTYVHFFTLSDIGGFPSGHEICGNSSPKRMTVQRDFPT